MQSLDTISSKRLKGHILYPPHPPKKQNHFQMPCSFPNHAHVGRVTGHWSPRTPVSRSASTGSGGPVPDGPPGLQRPWPKVMRSSSALFFLWFMFQPCWPDRLPEVNPVALAKGQAPGGCQVSLLNSIWGEGHPPRPPLPPWFFRSWRASLEAVVTASSWSSTGVKDPINRSQSSFDRPRTLLKPTVRWSFCSCLGPNELSVSLPKRLIPSHEELSLKDPSSSKESS